MEGLHALVTAQAARRRLARYEDVKFAFVRVHGKTPSAIGTGAPHGGFAGSPTSLLRSIRRTALPQVLTRALETADHAIALEGFGLRGRIFS